MWIPKFVLVFVFSVISFSGIQGADTEQQREARVAPIRRESIQNLPDPEIESLSTSLRSHNLYDKKIARMYLRRMSESENADQHPATRELLFRGKESDKVFSRAKLFRFLIDNPSNEHIAETLFQSSCRDDNFIGARILCSRDSLGLSPLRFQSVKYLKDSGNINEDQLGVLMNFSLQQNDNRYEASSLLYDLLYGRNRRFPDIAEQNRDRLLNSFQEICTIQDEKSENLIESYKILIKNNFDGRGNVDLLRNLLRHVCRVNISSPSYYKTIQSLFQNIFLSHFDDLKRDAIDIIRGGGFFEEPRKQRFAFFYFLINNTEDDLSEYYQEILRLSAWISHKIEWYEEIPIIETLKRHRDEDFRRQVFKKIYFDKQHADFRSAFYRKACEAINS